MFKYLRWESVTSITPKSRRYSTLRLLALTAAGSLALSACGGSSNENPGANNSEPSTQVFYQTNMMGQGDVVDRQLVIDGASVSVYSLHCTDGEPQFYTEGGWRGSLNADKTQIAWTEGERGTDEIVFAADGGSINLKNQPWKTMGEQDAINSITCD